jgi:hypothetical protein
MTEKDLLPCKKCGAKPVVHFTSIGGMAYVCPKCEMPQRYTLYFDQEEAITGWNDQNRPDKPNQ